MPRYEHKCDACGRDYIEQRTAEEPQYITNCECGGNFKLVDNG
jgi:predicted nucleic acid-binding Zn ribbon protein